MIDFGRLIRVKMGKSILRREIEDKHICLSFSTGRKSLLARKEPTSDRCVQKWQVPTLEMGKLASCSIGGYQSRLPCKGLWSIMS